MVDCTIDLTQDVVYNLQINKYRDLDQEIKAEIYSGDTYVSAFDFTGYSGATLEVRVKPNDAYTVLTFSTADGSIVLGANGVFELVKSALELKNVRSGTFYYDMYLTSASQNKRAFLSGEFIIKENISR